MKYVSLSLVAVCALAASGVVHSQIAAGAAAANFQQQQKPKRVRRVMAPPASAAPHAQARRSTAQSAAARANKPPLQVLPSFSVIDLDGHAVSTKDMVRKGHWLLVYQRQHCPPCDAVLKALAASTSPLLLRGAPYVIVVDAPNANELAQMRGNYPSLADAKWVADSGREAFKALKPKSAPVLYALRGSKIEFTVPGTLGNPGTVEKLASSWLARKDHTEENSPVVAASAGATPTNVAPAK